MSVQIRLNWIIASIDNLTNLIKISTPQPVVSQLTIDTNKTLTINFKSISYSSFSVQLTSDLLNIVF